MDKSLSFFSEYSWSLDVHVSISSFHVCFVLFYTSFFNKGYITIFRFILFLYRDFIGSKIFKNHSWGFLPQSRIASTSPSLLMLSSSTLFYWLTSFIVAIVQVFLCLKSRVLYLNHKIGKHCNAGSYNNMSNALVVLCCTSFVILHHGCTRFPTCFSTQFPFAFLW